MENFIFYVVFIIILIFYYFGLNHAINFLMFPYGYQEFWFLLSIFW